LGLYYKTFSGLLKYILQESQATLEWSTRVQ